MQSRITQTKGLIVPTSAAQQSSSAAHNKTKIAASDETQNLTVFAFARNLGTVTRKTLAESEDLHKAFLKGSDAVKRSMRLEFMIGYVTGALNVARDTAETVINGRVRLGAQPTLTKPARTKEQQNAYDAARKMFAFHISRDDKRVQQRTKQIRLSKAFKEAALAFVGEFYEEVNAAALTEVISMLQALKKRIDKVLPVEHEDHAHHTKH